MPLDTEQIHLAADALTERGERATLTAVRRELGGGSFSTISEAMQSWREQAKQEHELAEVQVPEAITERTQQLQAAIWQAAVTEAERRLAAEREALTQTQAEAEIAVTEAHEAVETLETEAQAHELVITQLKNALEAAKQQVRAAETAQHEAERALTAAEATANARITGLEERLVDAKTTIQTLIEKFESQDGQ